MAPEISRFLGMVVSIFYNDHDPAHFHVKYAEYRAAISIKELKIIQGELPSRILSLILEWAYMHREELFEDWQLARSKEPLKKIQPLV